MHDQIVFKKNKGDEYDEIELLEMIQEHLDHIERNAAGHTKVLYDKNCRITIRVTWKEKSKLNIP